MATTVRLPTRVEQALASYCLETKRTKSEVIIELLEQRFTGTGTDASPYEVAQAAGFIGCIDGTANGAASVKKLVKAKIRGKHSR
jgi:hypothetical protein